jgi:hypothetical protein
MRLSTGAIQVHRVDLAVIGHGLLTAMAIALIIAGLVAARERLVPHLDAGSADIVIPANLV